MYASKACSKYEDGVWRNGGVESWRSQPKRAVRLGAGDGGRYEERIRAGETARLGVENLESWKAVMMG